MNDAGTAPPPAPPDSPAPRRGILGRLLQPGGGRPFGAGWGPSGAFLGIALAVGASFVGALALYPATGTEGLDATLGNQLVLSLSLIGAAAGIAGSMGTAPPISRELGLRGGGTRRWAVLSMQTFFVYLMFAVAFASLVAEPEQTDVADELGFNASVLGAIVAGFAIVVAAPFCEEVFFRGLLFAGLRARIPFAAAAVVSGVIFGSIHLATGNLAAVVPLAVLGAMLAWLYERTGTLWAPIALHAANNAFAFAFLVST